LREPFEKSLPASLFQREEKCFPLLTKGDYRGLDTSLQKANVLRKMTISTHGMKVMERIYSWRAGEK
jgi:hypothetical protein